MSKEIWKLIELLCEYEDVYNWFATCTIRGEVFKREIKSDYMLDEDQNIIQIYIISKSYWFIEWLVENKKIDFRKVKEKIWLERELYERMLYWYKETDFLTMLLSIENEPINFLISILK